MTFAKQDSLTAAVTGSGFKYRAAWAVAILLAVLAVAIPLNQSAFAQTPEPSVDVFLVAVDNPTDVDYNSACENIAIASAVTVTESDYETGCVVVTLSDIGGMLDGGDPVQPDWILSVRYRATEQTHWSTKESGPGLDPD